MKMKVKQGVTYFHFDSYSEFLGNAMFLVGYSKENIVRISLELKEFLYLDEIGHISNLSRFCEEHGIALLLIQEGGSIC